MSSIRIPESVTDLYRDLRDRRLLIPVATLLIAIVAVPVALSTSSATPPAPLAAPASQEATAVEPAVLAEQTGLRSYKERLSALNEKDPFEQRKFEQPTEDSVAVEETATAPTQSSTPATTSTDVDAAAAAAPGGLVTPSSETPVSAAPDLGGGSGAVAPSEPTPQPAEPASELKPAPHFYAGRVDVRIGAHGEAKVIEGVSSLKFLPGDKNPVVAFLGLGEGGKSATFSVSTDVVSTGGEGHCAPKRPRPCRYLTLKVGEERELRYGADETPIRLKLLETHIVRVPDPRASDEPSGD